MTQPLRWSFSNRDSSHSSSSSSPGLYSKMSPGWQSSALHSADKVEKRTALALPVLRIERFTGVIPTFSASSAEVIFLLASIISTFTIIGMAGGVMVERGKRERGSGEVEVNGALFCVSNSIQAFFGGISSLNSLHVKNGTKSVYLY